MSGARRSSRPRSTAAQRLVFEINIDDAQNPILMTGLIAKLGVLPPGQSLHKMMAPERRALRRSCKIAWSRSGPHGPHAPVARSDHPRLDLDREAEHEAGEQLNPSEKMQQIAGVDVQLWNWAKTANKERAALETIEIQLRVFADLRRTNRSPTSS